MNDLNTVLVSIEDLREKLYELVRQGRTPLDPEVLKLSRYLDETINRYYGFTSKVRIK
jgi:Spo0E like sporulation regulatory protein.